MANIYRELLERLDIEKRRSGGQDAEDRFFVNCGFLLGFASCLLGQVMAAIYIAMFGL